MCVRAQTGSATAVAGLFRRLTSELSFPPVMDHPSHQPRSFGRPELTALLSEKSQFTTTGLV
jgi:hypothetical protein